MRDSRTPRPDSPLGYAGAEYARTLSHMGEPVSLPRSGGSLLARPIPGTAAHDAVGPYPLFACHDWAGLAADLDELGPALVSVVLVADPLGAWTPEQLAGAFPALARPYKSHHVLDLRERRIHRHHRRNVARAARRVHVDEVVDRAGFLEEWLSLYAVLTARHGIDGPAAFSRQSFAAQLALDDMTVLRAVADGEVVGATLWIDAGQAAYYHLGAYAPAGYELGAAYAMFAQAIETLAAQGKRWLALGAGAGAEGDAGDGLTTFKRRWGSATRDAWLCGRILDPAAYAGLSAGRETGSFFPAYRAASA